MWTGRAPPLPGVARNLWTAKFMTVVFCTTFYANVALPLRKKPRYEVGNNILKKQSLLRKQKLLRYVRCSWHTLHQDVNTACCRYVIGYIKRILSTLLVFSPTRDQGWPWCSMDFNRNNTFNTIRIHYSHEFVVVSKETTAKCLSWPHRHT